jgi:GT2 family glycosyltransferase
MSLVSVCIANYNGSDVISQCLDSVYQQRTEAAIEVIVYDDASSDDSASLVERLYPDVTLMRGIENVGFCQANNTMVSKSRGDFILLLNNDAWLSEDAVETLLTASVGRKGAILSLPQYDAIGGKLLDCGMGMDVFTTPFPLHTVVEREVATVMGACMWVPRETWELIEGFPEWFGSIAEDMYICQYARTLGRQVVVLSNSGYFHHVGHSFGGGKVRNGQLASTSIRRRMSERNRLFVMFLFYPTASLILLLPLQLFLLILEGLMLSAIKRTPRLFADVYWYALSGFFSSFSELVRKRVVVQKRRVIGIRAFFKTYSLAPQKLIMLFRFGVPSISG